MMKGVDRCCGVVDVCLRMAHTTQEKREATLKGLLELQFGIVDAANPLAAAAKAAGYEDEYDMALAVLLGKVTAARVRLRERLNRVANDGKRRRGEPVAETEEDKKVPDDEFTLVLAALLEQDPGCGGVRGPTWYQAVLAAFEELGGTMTSTKDGFYARAKRLVESGKVVAKQVKQPKRLYGRDVLMNVTLYSLPPEEAPAKEGGAA